MLIYMLGFMLSIYIHDDICLQYINQTGFRACVKELFVQQHDPLSISYAVMPGGMWKLKTLTSNIAHVDIRNKT